MAKYVILDSIEDFTEEMRQAIPEHYLPTPIPTGQLIIRLNNLSAPAFTDDIKYDSIDVNSMADEFGEPVEGLKKLKTKKDKDNLPKGGIHRFDGTRLVAGSITGAASTIKDFDFIADEDLSITGVQVFCKNPDFLDFISMQVLNSSDELVETFASSWGVRDGLIDIQVYEGKIPKGYKLRVKYTKSGSNNVDLWVNGYIHRLKK